MRRLLQINRLWITLAGFITVSGILIISAASDRSSLRPLISPESESPPAPTDEPESRIKPAVINQYAGTDEGPVHGRITCNNPVYTSADSPGIVRLEVSWNGLIPGKNGQAKADICFGVNGSNPVPVSTAEGVDGQTGVDFQPVSPNNYYDFILTDQHGGDLSDCYGNILAGCSIDTH